MSLLITENARFFPTERRYSSLRRSVSVPPCVISEVKEREWGGRGNRSSRGSRRSENRRAVMLVMWLNVCSNTGVSWNREIVRERERKRWGKERERSRDKAEGDGGTRGLGCFNFTEASWFLYVAAEPTLKVRGGCFYSSILTLYQCCFCENACNCYCWVCS